MNIPSVSGEFNPPFYTLIPKKVVVNAGMVFLAVSLRAQPSPPLT
jgi:hypothetical protein